LYLALCFFKKIFITGLLLTQLCHLASLYIYIVYSFVQYNDIERFDL
jgi:hypothetical protein